MIPHSDVLKIDRAITGKLVSLALAKGYNLSVCYGLDDFGVEKSRDEAAINEALHACDIESLVVYGADGKRLGWIEFVYGESGWDVICDYTVTPAVEELVDTGPIHAITDGICDNPENWRTILAANGAIIH